MGLNVIPPPNEVVADAKSRPDPHSWFDPSQGVTREVRLELEADFSSKTLSGAATLVLTAPSPGGPIDLDTRDLTIEGVFAADGTTGLDWKLFEADKILGARLRVQLPAGAKSLVIRYRTSPSASALQWLAPEQTAGKKHPYLFSQCQAIHARSVAPLQDSPGARIVYRAEITVPAPLVAVMSARAIGHATRGGRTRWSFEMPQPIPPYLLALAVGNLESRPIGPRSNVWSEPEMVEKAMWEFSGVEAMISAAEKLFGPYDWERFDLLCMPPSFPYGGMENPRITFLTPTLLAGDRSLVDVVAHELAHSWTGNLVSNASANDFWLNEGFTVYAERRILEALHGAESVALKASVGRIELQGDIDRFGKESPWTKLRNDLAGVDPDEVFSLVPYEKGFLFLTLLERTAGREAFDKFLAGYIAKFRFQSITTADFEAEFERACPGVLAKVEAKSWIDAPGIPANEPRFAAPRLDRISALAKAWPAHPDAAEAKKWDANEWHFFLRALPAQIDLKDAAWLDETFGLTKQGNMEVLVAWLGMAAASGYEPCYPRVREVLQEVGRMRYLKPLYRALLSRKENVPMAQKIFRNAKDGYHGIAAGGIAAMIKDA
ncbi:MAG TPA: M1 family metallopeptidase [bacterium]|nr:M1 family metallopeptidase [bacterium]